MAFEFSIPTRGQAHLSLSIEPGSTVYFVGANGSGKTRLAVLAEEALADRAHRISAHRALALNPEVNKIPFSSARRLLDWGADWDGAGVELRSRQRWRDGPSVSLLDDYDQLLQLLFAEQANTAVAANQSRLAGENTPGAVTYFHSLTAIWEQLHPGRKLLISGDYIAVSAGGSGVYSAKQLSDGERATFYLIAQALAAEPQKLLIFDEPELHLHRAIMSRLWDELEAARSDCAMLVITHDLEFVASRVGKKFVLREYAPPAWDIEDVPDRTGFSEQTTTLILGSRKPVLFVEGTAIMYFTHPLATL